MTATEEGLCSMELVFTIFLEPEQVSDDKFPLNPSSISGYTVCSQCKYGRKRSWLIL